MVIRIYSRRLKNKEDEVTIDGVSGDEIPGKFAEIYKDLYNMSSDEEAISGIRNQIKDTIGQHDMMK